MSWLLNNTTGDRWNETVRHYAEIYDKEVLNGTLTKDKLFEIGSVLVRSNCSQYIRLSVDILEHLCTTVDSKVSHRSYLIYLTIGYIRLKAFELAHNCLKQLKIIDPNCRQGAELEVCLQKQRLNAKSGRDNEQRVSTLKSEERMSRTDTIEDNEEKRFIEIFSTHLNQTF